MTSNGGVATPEMIAAKPASTLLSGLVAGVRGGAWVGRHAGADRLITLDIGGTSADIGIVVDGRPYRGRCAQRHRSPASR